ncbi:fatty acid desaturase family protein [Nocardiopsis lambiniae]|uniref:Acyl-CoA desaturase n=1 Tax=Nocardiopsis lambiniae TaxID=3075539 RepID=A0ABU2MDX5_9ACTN|nr:acyl-CoA desaturase [Nocardiopsis sp. DSM 44743]MDT0330760.1 acyl-CoA desaturase [Nocardiopsis sp. DSM 44743]
MTRTNGTSSERRRGSDYAVLSREVSERGLLRRRRGHYTARIAITLSLLLAAWTAFVLIGPSWWQMVTAVVLGLIFTQTAFIGHDAGHGQIAESERANRLIGWIHGDLLVGLAFGWWVDKHDRHHAHPNHEGKDPDIAGAALAFSREQALLRRRGPGRWLARSQAWLFFPMLLLEAFHLHVASVRWIVKGTGPSVRTRIVEGVLLALHLGGYLTIVLMTLTPLQALCFVLVHQAVFGLYMGCSFAPNHKGMPVLAEEAKAGFLQRQVLTSRNVRGGRVVDLVLGGLNYQIEHHLFPSMPRPNLRHAQPLVRAACERIGLAYYETGLLRSYAEVLGHLHRVGGPLRPELEY